MEIRQLKYFVNVAETHSFSEASRQCFLSQSAISQQIKLLEEELDTQLFLRNTHSVALTVAGEQLLPLARQALKSFDTCQEHMMGIRGLITGQLNIGMTEAMEPYVRHTVVEMLKRYPKLHINMYYKPTHELNRMLKCHELDLAFSINTASEDEGIESQPITSYRVCAVMSRNHVLARRDRVSVSDLVGQNFILPERSSGSVRTLKKFVPQDVFEQLNVRAYADSANAILNILQETNYVSFLSPYSVSSRPSLVAKDVAEFPARIQCYVHQLQDVCQKQSAKVFLDILGREAIPYYNSMEE